MEKSPSNYTVPLHNRLLRLILRPVFRGIFHILSRVRVNGLENVPKGEAYLIAFNHVSLFDPPLLVAFWPEAPEAAGASDLWSRPGQNVLVRMYGGIQVHRGQYDRKLFQDALSVLEAGRPLVIAPEGGRSHTPGMRRGLPGIAYITDLAGVPVIPVGVVGATDDFFTVAIRGKRPTVEMNIGKPLHLPRLSSMGMKRQDARQHNTDLIMGHIAELLPIEYRGVYA